MKKTILCLMVLVSLIFMGRVKAYSEYKIGDKITLDDEEYYVIQNSSSTDDYLIVLKANPLTAEEIEQYGTGHINKNSEDSTVLNTVYEYEDGVGGVSYYNSDTCKFVSYDESTDIYTYSTTGVTSNVETMCKSDYASSDVKAIVDAWVSGTFKSGILKPVDNYQARLLNMSDLIRLGYDEALTDMDNNFKMHVASSNVYDWLYSDTYDYWTMDSYSVDTTVSTKEVWSIFNQNSNPIAIKPHHVAYYKGAIRPVLNVNKSAIEKNITNTSSNDSKDNDNVKVADTLLQRSLVGTIIGLVLIGMGISVYLITLKKSNK